MEPSNLEGIFSVLEDIAETAAVYGEEQQRTISRIKYAYKLIEEHTASVEREAFDKGRIDELLSLCNGMTGRHFEYKEIMALPAEVIYQRLNELKEYQKRNSQGDTDAE